MLLKSNLVKYLVLPSSLNNVGIAKDILKLIFINIIVKMI